MNKLEIYERLGAKKFKKIVLKVENIKYMILKPFSKQIINLEEKILNKRLNKMLKKEKDEQKRKLLIRYFNKEKLRTRIEFNNKENRNYHYNNINPRETLNYLNINKKIHIKGIKFNILYITISGIIILLLNNLTIPLTIISLNMIGLFINFQCINLQNYNIIRLEQKIEKLTQIRERKLKQKIKLYKEISKTLSPLLNNTNALPQKEDIINCVETQEEIQELQDLIQNTIKSKERKLKL